MAFDPITLLTISALLLVVMGTLMIQSSHSGGTCVPLRWWGAALLVAAFGLGLILSSPGTMRSPLRVLGNAALLLTSGIAWGATRHFAGRSFHPLAVLAGAAGWFVLALVFDPGQGTRIAFTSVTTATYSAAIAWEFHRDDTGRLPARRWAAWVFAAHGTFFLMRALLGPTFGFGAWGQNIAQSWGALLGVETMLFAVVFGSVAMALSREMATDLHRQRVLEDLLTGIGNRRALFESGATLLAEMARQGRPAALLLMDLDGFKLVNDGHGHQTGDRLLVAFARLAHDYLPPTALVCRFGGEEFAAVLPGADQARACAIADELRSLFAHLSIEGSAGPVGTTVSIGIAQASAARQEMADLMARADRCLYAAKGGGRNRVVHEADVDELKSAA